MPLSSPESLEPPQPVEIGPDRPFTLGTFTGIVTSFIGQFLDVYYFQVAYGPVVPDELPMSGTQSDSEIQGEASYSLLGDQSPSRPTSASIYTGLLRVGNLAGGLKRELALRLEIGSHRMVNPLLYSGSLHKVTLSCLAASSAMPRDYPIDSEVSGLHSSLQTPLLEPEIQSAPVLAEDGTQGQDLSPKLEGLEPLLDTDQHEPEIIQPDQESEQLPEDFLEEQYYGALTDQPYLDHALVTLSSLPEANLTLAQFLQEGRDDVMPEDLDGQPDQPHSGGPLNTRSTWIDRLTPLIQLCQVANYLQKQGWCWVCINPQWIEIGQPIRLYDFTGAFLVGDSPPYGISGPYWPPELLLGHAIDEPMVSFTLGAILYHLVYGHPLQGDPLELEQTLKFPPVPGLNQVLKACLARGDDRLPIPELLPILVDLQQQSKRIEIDWIQGCGSTLGLSESRWTNEDSYGVRYQASSSSVRSIILGILADGMGGLEQGEVASQCAVQTLLNASFSQGSSYGSPSSTINYWQKWLIEQFQVANQRVAKVVRNGGTTLSAILAVDDQLMVAHVGDSRIFLIRNGMICQISEDHSLVFMLWMTGQITYAEIKDHPDRSVLLKSLGSSHRMPDSDIQTLDQFGLGTSLVLQDRDLLLLCSDGVWDLVLPSEMCDLFAPLGAEDAAASVSDLQVKVDQVLQWVIDRGAHDNATLVCLQCFIDS